MEGISATRHALKHALTAPRSPEDAAECIVALVIDPLRPGHEEHQYRGRAKAWLCQILTAEPDLTLQQLAQRLSALAELSAPIRLEVGALASRIYLFAVAEDRAAMNRH